MVLRSLGFLFFLVVCSWTPTVKSYSKYGRTCKDINCPTNEMCVLETNECSYYQRENECSYPTCKRDPNASKRPTCAGYVCPPTKICQLHNGITPKCVDDLKAEHQRDHAGYDTKSINTLYPNIGAHYPEETTPRTPPPPAYNPGAAGVRPGETTPRPNINQNPYAVHSRPGETTPRPNIARPYNPYPSSGGGGYQGGHIGSGYPGYPAQSHGNYGTRGGYYGQQYPTGGQNYGGGYPTQQQGNYYSGGYGGQRQKGGGSSSYYNNGASGSNSKNTGGGFLDSLQSLGTGFLRDALKRVNLR